MRAGKAFPPAGIACKLWRENGAFRKSDTVVWVKVTADKAEEGGGNLVLKALIAIIWILFWRYLVIKGF